MEFLRETSLAAGIESSSWSTAAICRPAADSVARDSVVVYEAAVPAAGVVVGWAGQQEMKKVAESLNLAADIEADTAQAAAAWRQLGGWLLCEAPALAAAAAADPDGWHRACSLDAAVENPILAAAEEMQIQIQMTGWLEEVGAGSSSVSCCGGASKWCADASPRHRHISPYPWRCCC